MMKIKNLAVLLLATGVSAGANAQAQTPTQGWYVTANVGQSNVDIENIDLASLGVTGSESKDEDDTAWRLGVGYKFNPYIAIEGGYVDFGKFEQKANITSPISGSIRGDVEVDGWFADLVGSYPLGNNFSVLGRIGAVRTSMDLKLSDGGGLSGSLSAAGVDSKEDKSEWNLRYGLGVQYDFSPMVGMRLEYDRTADVGDKDTTGEGDIDTWTVGVVWRF